MKKLLRTALMTALGLTLVNGVSGRPVESTSVKVPFAFAVGTQLLPAGTYKIELTTQAQPGKDLLEVVVLRGKDQRVFASFVSRVMGDRATTTGMTFQRTQGREFLAEIRAWGKRLEPSATPDELRTGNAEAEHDLIAEQDLSGR